MGTTSGGEWEGGMYAEGNMETYLAICKIDGQWEFAVRLRELKTGLHNTLGGWGGEQDGRLVQVGGGMGKLMADSCWCLVEINTIL